MIGTATATSTGVSGLVANEVAKAVLSAVAAWVASLLFSVCSMASTTFTGESVGNGSVRPNSQVYEKHLKPASEYIQDGLVAMWDGIENAGPGVHDDGASTWKNLAGDNDLTIYSGATWGMDALVCDGSNVGASGLFAFDLSSMTMSCCVSDMHDTSSFRNFVCTPSSATVNSGCCGIQVTENTVYMSALFRSTKSSKMSITMVGNNMTIFNKDRNNPSAVIVNGNKLAKITYVSINNSGRYCSVGARRNSDGKFAYPCGGKVHNLRIYNRALTDEEIIYNYEVDKARFNLP